MSAPPTGPAMEARFVQEKPKAHGFLHIVRHGAGAGTMYVVTYHRLDRKGLRPHPILAEGAQPLIELLEELGVDFRLGDVRGALADILRFGSANIPDLWFCGERLARKGLIDSEMQ
jgi:hypothetical protein